MSQPPDEPHQPGQAAYSNQPPLDPNGYGLPPGAAGYPPPSGKKNTRLIVGLGAAGVLALVAIIVGVVILASGSDGEDRITSDGETTQSASPSDEPSADPTAEASEESDPTESTSPAPQQGRLVGDGYSYDLPEEWNDISEDILAQNPPGAINTVSTWGSDIESGRANLIVERQLADASDPEELRESWEGNLGTAVGVTPVSGPDTEVDGEKAISATLKSVNNQDVSVAQTAYLLVVDGAVFSVTLSAEDGDDGAQDAFDDIVESWSWE